MRYIQMVTAILCGFAVPIAPAAPTTSPWDQPAAALAEKIAAILGPGQAKLAVRNLSSVPTEELPVIRGLLETDLKGRGVSVSGADSASSVRVTLSESATERLLVAEITEGNETQVAMVDVGPIQPASAADSGGILLRKQMILSAHEPILAVLETPAGVLALEPEQVVFYLRAADGLHVSRQAVIREKSPLARDPRGILRASADEQGFDAWIAGAQCTGPVLPADPASDWAVRCNASDDPWPILSNAGTLGSGTNPAGAIVQGMLLKAFYNAGRNYFTGVITPAVGIDVPPFYSAAALARSAAGSSLLIGGIDSSVRLVENGSVHKVSGTRDWGSDFAVLDSGCGAGEQVIASGSGEAIHDSLRAYDLPGYEAVPASAPLTIDGTITALWTSPDRKSVLAAVRKNADQYEVDRVSALCN